MLNLDTHILIFALAGELRPAEHSLLGNSRWSISSIVLWELAKLVQLGGGWTWTLTTARWYAS